MNENAQKEETNGFTLALHGTVASAQFQVMEGCEFESKFDPSLNRLPCPMPYSMAKIAL